MNLEQYDPEYAESVGVVITHNRASTSFLSRKLGCGYNTASRYMMRMQDEGIVSKPNHVGARQVLRSPELAADNIALQAEVESLKMQMEILSPLYSKRQALADENERLRNLLGKCVGILDATIEESKRGIEYGEEDPFRMGEWFEEDDMIALEAARAALNETPEHELQ